jgi:pimeloyl-ACP methyl ester carboxylesterase
VQGKLPLLCLHGGPGDAHDYLVSLQAMAETGRRVNVYDQLRSGRSFRGPGAYMQVLHGFLTDVETWAAAAL